MMYSATFYLLHVVFLYFLLFLYSLLCRCLHELRPHGGRPLSCLLFCDNHKRQDPELVYTGSHGAFIGNGDMKSLISGMQLFEFQWVDILFLLWPVMLRFSQGSFLAVSDNWSGSEPGVENMVHRFLDLFTDHQVVALRLIPFCVLCPVE